MKNKLLAILISGLFATGLFAFSGGNGTVENPYEVSNAVELDSVRYFLGSHFIQTADIDLGVDPWNTGAGWIPIGNSTTPFTGSYDGGEHTIMNLFIDVSTNLVGLFGATDGANIMNISMTSVDITGGVYVGCIVGFAYNSTAIADCYLQGSVLGTDEVGGITGYIKSSSISTCTTSVTATAGANAGGISGTVDESQVINCSSSSDITASGDYAGGIAAYVYINSKVTLCDFNGSVAGVMYVGGLIGFSANSTITDSNSNSIINGARRSSALVGGCENDSIMYCYSTGTITGDECGGISGEIIGSTVMYCNSDVTVNGQGWGISGCLIGRCDASEVSYCFSSGSVTDDWVVGGLIGSIHNSSTVSNCYSDADAECTIWSVGGLLGESYDSNVNNSFSIGQVTGPDYYGGLIGYIERSSITNSYWDIETSGQTTSDGGIGKSTAEMKQQSTYTGWDFSTPVWNIHSSLNNGYPYLEWEGRIPVEDPLNPAIVWSSSNTTLTWDPVVGATEYLVYSSDDPYGPFTLDLTGSFNGAEWTAPTPSADKMFYYIVAVNPTK